MLDSSKISVQYLTKISFSTYTADEIKKLSVLEVTNPQTFDALQHPTKGGLHDLRLGAVDHREICETCRKTSAQCPGHFGHITLPVPVFNPLFIRSAFQLLKGSCLSCHRFRASKVSCELILAQLKALEYGLIRTASEMEQVIGEVISDKKVRQEVDGVMIKQKLDDMLTEALKNTEADMQDSLVKNVVDSRQTLINAFLKHHIQCAPKTCTRCGVSRRLLHLENNCKLIMSGYQVRNKITVKKKTTSVDEFGNVMEEENDEDNVEDTEENTEKEIKNQTYMTVLEARDYLYKLCDNEKELILHLFGAFGGRNIDSASRSSPVEGLFIDVLPVPPSRFRPLSRFGGKSFINPHTSFLELVVQCCILVNKLLFAIKTNSDEINMDDKFRIRLPAGSNKTKFQFAWFTLQNLVNKIFDSDLDKYDYDKIPGVKQLIEKKEGLFRKNMMGKRVNYAARSVISPDPYIDVDEIGIPEIFAKKLTYPQPVTPWNIRELRQAVINGPHTHPGATLIRSEDGTTIFLGRDNIQREAIAKSLLTPSLNSKNLGTKIVYRHLRGGDVLLINRQPTLHKPSIMAHKVRILRSEKTIRMNYSNCKTYNADFDGDEMNAHFPQNELARSEAYTIANVAHQYLVPKDGTPLGGLIQDHIVAAVLLMMRGKFFTREDYQQLVFGALIRMDDRISLQKSSIVRPCCLWSGKQVISTIIINTIPARKQLITLEGTSKISAKSWIKGVKKPWLYGGTPLIDPEMSENQVIIRNGELLCGILDKAHFGATPYGLIHCCYELYGGDVSSRLLSQFSRLFTQFLQLDGFTLGVRDILVTAKADKRRGKIMKWAKDIGNETACDAFDLPTSSQEKDIKSKYAESHLSTDGQVLKYLDFVMKEKTDRITNDINNQCVPDGLLKRFPENNLQLMVVSGAKGSSVNCMQISALLGQIELEGRRPPLMISGRTLPSFLAYDTSPRAGGFIDGRFLTGIRPQECFFHCMAGREGLIDTAVKTSRSGYLQRCLVKHLEGVTVAYDLTVRDCDGSVIQFQYGEDALDVEKLQFLNEKQIKFLVDNSEAAVDETAFSSLMQNCDYKSVIKKSKKIRKYLKKNRRGRRCRMSGFSEFSKTCHVDLDGSKNQDDPNVIKNKQVALWFEMDKEKRALLGKNMKTPDPINAIYRIDLTPGAISEKMDELVESYLTTSKSSFSASDYTKLMHYKILSSICEPGESVGLLAAQSIGEPSTQMTLNTFHFAGRGEMNVTLGIPRLREILMVASANIATPAMEIPFLNVSKLHKKSQALQKKLNPIYLSQVLQSVSVKEKMVLTTSNKMRIYTVLFQFLPHSSYKKELALKSHAILSFMEDAFFRHLMSAIKLQLQVMNKSSLVTNVTVRPKAGPVVKDDGGAQEEEEEKEDNDETSILRENTNKGKGSDGESSAEDEEPEADATTARNRARHEQDREYEEEMDDEEKEIQKLQSDAENDENAEYENSRPSTPNESLSANEEEEPTKETQEVLNHKDDRKSCVRIKNVLELNDWITHYRYDDQKEEWCELTISMSIKMKKIDMTQIIKDQIKKSIVHHTKKINKAIVIDERKPDGSIEKILKTDGINILEMFKYEGLLDLNRLYSNDIHAIANTYGIEAAMKVIVKEIKNVFGCYGIQVDPRHLLLIADYMTFDGKFKPCNRCGLANSASPLQQMSFETTMQFLRNATVSGQSDTLKSPSSRLVIGRPVASGTGCFDVIQPLRIAKRKK